MPEIEKQYKYVTDTVTSYMYTVRIESGEPVETMHSGTCLAVTGYPAQEFIDDPYLWIQMVIEEDRDLVQQQINHILSKQFPQSIEHRIKRKDGIVCWVDSTVFPRHDTEGNLISYIGFVRDITGHRQAKDDLIRSEKKFRELFNNANDAIYLWELREDGMPGKCIEVNDIACRMSGYTKDELLTMTPKDIDAEESVSKIPGIMNELLARGHSTFEMIHRTKDGCRIPVEISSHIYSFEGEKVILSISRDITERKQAEEERQKIHKLESIGILAGGIAHDFNNLLAAIRNNIYLSMMHVDRENIAYENLKSTENIIHRATNLTQQLLIFSKGGTPVKKAASIVEIIKESAEFALKGSNTKYEFDAVDSFWPVEVDEGQMNQVIHNLILNADQSMPEGGTIRIFAENYNFDSDTELPLQEGKYVKVVIQDQGIAIAADNLKKIFDPYFTTKQMGHGLGLSIVYSIIKNHNGYISVESETGVGTTFTIYLPASEKQIEEKETAEDTFAAGEGKVLIMDDEEIIRESVEQLLTYKGYEVECAKDGDEAIVLYKKALGESQPFDTVILDLTIRGGMGGKETVKKLLEIDPDVKAIVASGYSNDPVLANFKEYGFCGVFAKHDKTEELGKTLHKVINGYQ